MVGKLLLELMYGYKIMTRRPIGGYGDVQTFLEEFSWLKEVARTEYSIVLVDAADVAYSIHFLRHVGGPGEWQIKRVTVNEVMPWWKDQAHWRDIDAA